MAEKNYEIMSEWIDVAEQISKHGPHTLIFLGGVDTGKTFAAISFLKYFVHHGKSVGYIDADIGQSNISVPGTISYVKLEKKIENLDNIVPTHSYFVGSNTPTRHLLPIIVGIKKLIDIAKQDGVDLIVIDTTGMIKGIGGRILKEYIIELIAPVSIFALERDRNLSHILRVIEKKDTIIYRFPMSNKIINKDMRHRKGEREKKFKAYFKSIRDVELDLSKFALMGTFYMSGRRIKEEELARLSKEMKKNFVYGEKIPEGYYLVTDEKITENQDSIDRIIVSTAWFRNLIIGLNDKHDFLVSLGIIKNFDFEKSKIILHTPISDDDLKNVVTLNFGSINLLPTGRELGKTLRLL